MKAIVAKSYGGPEVFSIQDVAKPNPKSNEILIQVKASSITRADTMMRTGKPYIGRLITGLSGPKNSIPGTGFAGVVVSLGKEVSEFNVGDKVFGENITSFGTNAEFVCVPKEGVVAKLPSKITFAEAASLCDGAITSMNFLKLVGQVKPSQKVLINGASGSLGTAAVQLAKYYGAEVTGVCSASNLGLVKSLGADQVIDYTKQDFTQTNQVYDIIYDTVGTSSFSKCKKSLSTNGAFISPVLGLPLLMDMMQTSLFGKKKAKFSATGVLPVETLNKLLSELTEMIELGKLKSVVDKTYALSELAAAHSYIDNGHKKGNVVIQM